MDEERGWVDVSRDVVGYAGSRVVSCYFLLLCAVVLLLRYEGTWGASCLERLSKR